MVTTPDPAQQLPFTLKDIREAIPAKLFEASLTRSWYYIARDLVQTAVTVAVTAWLLSLVPDSWKMVRAALWILYGCVQGTTWFGLWVIGHECGHQAYFGHRKSLNTAVGFIIHTTLLVPYHAWRITHATHHRYTNHIDRDTAFPPHREAPPTVVLGIDKNPFLCAVLMPIWVMVGWVFYLCLNWEGQVYSVRANHFEPASPMFKPSDRVDLIVSNIALGSLLIGFTAVASVYGWGPVLCWYGLPWLVCHSWLVVITLLQHTDEKVPHYAAADWDFVKGALATVDRDYGIFNKWMHHITDGHVLHHLFSTMPFYNAIEATPYVKSLLGEHYHSEHGSVLKALWTSWRLHGQSYLISKRLRGSQ